MDPAGGPTSADAAVTIIGTHFYARAVQSLSNTSGISVDDDYSAKLDGVPLRKVKRVSDTQLSAIVPAGLTAGQHALTVVGPYGLSGTLERGWFASDQPPARLTATAGVPAQLSTGQSFTMLVTVQNTGGVTALGVSPTIQLSGTATASYGAAPAAEDIPGGESRTFSWPLVAGQAGTLAVTTTAIGTDQVSQRPVASAPAGAQSVVQQRSALAVQAVAPAQTTLSVGQSVTLTLVATNTGTATALGVAFPSPQMTDPALQLVSSPATQDIGGGSNASFTWVYQAVQEGQATPTESGGAGTDENDGLPVTAPSASWPSLTIQTPPQIVGTGSAAPSQVTVQQTFSVSLQVKNQGEATALAVTPVLRQSGSGAASVVSSPTATDIAGGGAATFVWSLSGTTAGSVSLSLDASGTDANSGATVQMPTAAAGPVTVQTPPSLSASLSASPSQASTGQPIQLTLTVTNAGQATAAAVTPTTPVANGPVARLLSGPAAQDIPGGTSRSLSWSYEVDAAGTVSFAVAASGKDQNSGATVQLATTTSNSVTVKTAAFLEATATLDRLQVSTGQNLILTLNVSNVGQADALNVSCAVSVSGTGAATPLSSPGAQSVPAQTTRTFQWTYQSTSKGTLSFNVTASGTDALSNAPLTATASAGPATVQVPAAIAATIAASPATVNTGQPIVVTVTVNDSGEASAQAVTPTLSIGGAAATILSGPTPASATITGGGNQVFTWSVSGSAAGTVTFSSTVSASDANTGQTLSASTQTPASVTVQTPAALAVSFTAPPNAVNVNVGQSFQVTLTVTNSGDSAANAVAPSPLALTGSGSATRATGPNPASATIAGHASQGFAFTYTGSSPGPLTFNGSASGTDATSGANVSTPTATSSTVTVQTPSSISATLAIPQTIPLSDTFAVALTVTNSGDASVNLAVPGTPSIATGSTGTATMSSGPSPSMGVTLAGHSDQTFTWSFTATGEGTLKLQAQISGTDANDGSARTASAASAVASIAEVVLLASDPFADGTAFSFLFDFSGQLWLGPAANGTGAVRMNADGSGAQPVTWQIEHSTAASNTFYRNALAHTIGDKGCTSNTSGCGPDNESGRALFFHGIVGGTEWLGLAGAHVNSGTDYARFVYFTNGTFPLATGGYTDFAYTDLSSQVSSSTSALTSAAVFHNRVYLGFRDTSTQDPVLEALSTMPSLPGSAPSSGLADMGATNMPGVGGGAMIDSMAVFGTSPNDALYLANARGFTRTTTTSPSQCQSILIILTNCSDWTDATPSAFAYSAKVALATTKTSDLEPADRAVSAFASFGGRLYAARNTTTGPQLWSCDPTRSGSTAQCDPGDWSLAAPNTSGDTQLTQFNDANNAAITLLAATSQHLYVGFNNSVRGVVLYRTANATAATVTDFTGRLGCTANGSSCHGIGGDGLSAGVTRLFDGRALTFAGTDYLYLAAGTGSSPVRIYRAIR
jgi:uncharacterized repeat protein (TIGR01451 family)